MHRAHTSSPPRRATRRTPQMPRSTGRRRRDRAMLTWTLVAAASMAACTDDGSSELASNASTAATTVTASASPAAPSTEPTTTAVEPSVQSPVDVAGFLDAVASTESDIGPGIAYVVDQVGAGRYDAGYRRRQDAIAACSAIEVPLLHGATFDQAVDGRGWLYLDIGSPQRPYVAHSVMVLADESAAAEVMSELRAASELPTCVAQWVADVNRDDAGEKNAPWSSAAIEYSGVDAAVADPLDGLGEDQLSITWQQHQSIDGVDTPPEEMAFHIARVGAVIFTFSGNDPERTAATAVLLAARTQEALSSVGEEERIETVRARRQAMAEAALLDADDLGADWSDLGPDNAFPMTAALAAAVPSCAPFIDIVFDDNAGVWAHTALGRNADIAFTSVTVFATEAEAAAMVAATSTPEFDECWSDFNEVAVVELPFGIESADYASVEPPDIELAGDSSSLHALDGTITVGATDVADTCVCAFVQRGRTVVTFHAAAPVFTAEERRDLIVTAVARVDEEVE
jgi:hypothetical protein